MRKIIFLDIDGVFNCQEWAVERHENKLKLEYPVSEFCPKRVELFNKLAKEINAEVVISSSWRHSGLNKVREVFNSVGINCNIIDKTPDLRGDWIVRGDEIKKWIDDNLKGECGIDYQYCIIDDDDDMLYSQRNNFIQTTELKGLTSETINSVLKLFKHDKPHKR